MAKLTAKARSKIPAGDFAGRGRSYPIENKAHAIAAERDAGFHPAEKARIDARVHAKYPHLTTHTSKNTK